MQTVSPILRKHKHVLVIEPIRNYAQQFVSAGFTLGVDLEVVAPWQVGLVGLPVLDLHLAAVLFSQIMLFSRVQR